MTTHPEYTPEQIEEIAQWAEHLADSIRFADPKPAKEWPGDTVAKMLRALASQLAADQRQPLTRDSESEGLGEPGRLSPVTDEREAFEKWFYSRYPSYNLNCPANYRTDGPLKISTWETWQARAALQSEQASTNAIAQPVSVPDAKAYGKSEDYSYGSWEVNCTFVDGWNACRAAMLSAAPKREGE
jgi:hypothetical protein